LVSYRRNEALMSAATAVSTGVWAVALTAALTEGSLVPLVVAAVLGVAMIAWGAKLTRK
jgi:CHASE2 domain-containing sensor protein